MVPADRALGAVVELGPGTGAFTVALQERTPARHLGIELNTLLANRLAADFPMVEVETAPAERLERILDSKDLVGRVDQVVSGLPWQAFAGPVGGELIPAIARVLRPGGPSPSSPTAGPGGQCLAGVNWRHCAATSPRSMSVGRSGETSPRQPSTPADDRWRDADVPAIAFC